MSREEEEEGSLGLEVQVFEKKVERKRFYSSFFFFFFFKKIIIEKIFRCCNLSNVL